MNLVSNYQRMLDSRLSAPKAIKKVEEGRHKKVYKNTAMDEQLLHQSVFSERARLKNHSVFEDKLGGTIDERTVGHLNTAFGLNYRQYNVNDKPSKLSDIKQTKY